MHVRAELETKIHSRPLKVAKMGASRARMFRLIHIISADLISEFVILQGQFLAV